MQTNSNQRLLQHAAKLFESARELDTCVGESSCSWEEVALLVSSLQLTTFALADAVERLAGHTGWPLADLESGGDCRAPRNHEAYTGHTKVSAGHLLLAGEHLNKACNAAFGIASAVGELRSSQ